MREITYQIKGECWHCTSHKPNTDGYPIAKIAGKNRRIGRLFFERFKGKIPEGKIVRHTCDNRICINPGHLILGTHADNMRDMAERGRSPFGRNHHNVFGLCVRWGFPALKPIHSTKFKLSTKDYS